MDTATIPAIIKHANRQLNGAKQKGYALKKVICPECGFRVDGIDVSAECASDSGVSIEIVAHCGPSTRPAWCGGSARLIDPITK